MKYTCIVTGRGVEPRTFVIDAHKTVQGEPRLIESGFYLQHVGAVPRGVHHELEIVEPTVWEKLPGSTGHLHYHIVPDSGRQFICFTGALRTLEAAESVIGFWCAGTTYTLMTGIDFAQTHAQHPDDFLEYLESEHGITFELRQEVPAVAVNNDDCARIIQALESGVAGVGGVQVRPV